MSLKEEDLEKIIRLRFAVGCLGEQGDAKWWKGSFLSPTIEMTFFSLYVIFKPHIASHKLQVL